MTSHIQPRLKVAKGSVKRIREKHKENFRRARGRRLDRFIAQELNPILRGWGHYFKLAEVEGLVACEPVGEVELKGFHKPLAAHNVTGLKAN